MDASQTIGSYDNAGAPGDSITGWVATLRINSEDVTVLLVE